MTRLAWLTTPAVEATARAVKTSIEKLVWLRNMDAHLLDLSMLPTERRRFLATVGRRSTVQALERRGDRRYPILLALVAQSAVDQLDEVVRAVRPGGVGAGVAGEVQDRRGAGRAGEDAARSGSLLLDVILPVLADPAIPDEQVGGLLREQIGMQQAAGGGGGRMEAAAARPWPAVGACDSSYSYLRQFTPDVLSVIDFQGGPGTAELMEAVAILKELNRTGGRKVPEEAPEAFVPARYAEYLEKARKAGDDTSFRHYWELCVVLGLRDGLRSGDVFVPGSRRYADPSTYLFTPEQWAPRREALLQAGRQARQGR